MKEPQSAPEHDSLRRVNVRWLRPEERERFDRLLASRHSLHSARGGGPSLRYVAEVDGQGVALLVFSGAAPHTKARENEIGWTPRQRARRRCFVVNNSRLLVLPERQQYPNLASRVAALRAGTASTGHRHFTAGSTPRRFGGARGEKRRTLSPAGHASGLVAGGF